MNRRKFIKVGTHGTLSLAILSSMGLMQCKSADPKVESQALLLKSVAEGSLKNVRGRFSRFNSKGGTIGVLESSEGYLIVDTQYPNTVQSLLDAIHESRKPIQYIFNTHHHGDHTAGNIVFKDSGATLVAQSQVPIYQKKRAKEKGNEEEQYYATHLFERNYELKQNKDKLSAYHFGAAHTFGDAVYHFENENVIHVGDLVFQNLLPVFRVADGSHAQKWAEVLEQVISKFEKDSIFIFGHAEQADNTQGSMQQIQEMQQFMNDLAEFAEKEIVQAGKTEVQLLKEYSFIPNYPNRKPIWQGHWEEFIQNLVKSVQAT